MNRRLATLTAIFVVLLLIYVVRWLAGASTATRRASGFVLETVNPDAIAKIEIIHQKDTVHLVKQGNTWKVQLDSTLYRPASLNRIRNWRKTMEEARYLRISQNPDKFAAFQVTEDQGIRIRYRDAQGHLLADFFVGKMGPDFTTCYVREANGKAVYLAEPGFRSVFPTRRDAWRERRLLPEVKAEDLVYLKLVDHEAGDSLVLVRDTAGWHAQGAEVTDTVAAWRLVRQVALSTAIGFADTVPYDSTGLAQPRKTIVLSNRDGESFRLLIGKPTPNGRGVYAAREGREDVVVLSKYLDRQLSQLPKDIVAPAPKPSQAPSGSSP